ncbi:MAG: hypothetical protein QGH73_16155 [Rhodospirillales bacterium]|jgi:hypothetical protein|nr:hypothetical protein [Alphaproteobacteria bacterium]MDP6843204.1 hypothetical protein [Rhodospirillales bacterium]
MSNHGGLEVIFRAIDCGAACTLPIRHPDHEETIRPASVHGFMHQMHFELLEDVVEHAPHPDHFKRVAERKDGGGK